MLPEFEFGSAPKTLLQLRFLKLSFPGVQLRFCSPGFLISFFASSAFGCTFSEFGVVFAFGRDTREISTGICVIYWWYPDCFCCGLSRFDSLRMK